MKPWRLAGLNHSNVPSIPAPFRTPQPRTEARGPRTRQDSSKVVPGPVVPQRWSWRRDPVELCLDPPIRAGLVAFSGRRHLGREESPCPQVQLTLVRRQRRALGESTLAEGQVANDLGETD